MPWIRNSDKDRSCCSHQLTEDKRNNGQCLLLCTAIYVCVRVRVCMHACVCVRVCVCACMCACMCVCVRALRI